MDCKSIESTISLYIDGELSKNKQAEFEEHISKCSKCSKLLEETRFTVNFVSNTPKQSLPAGYYERFSGILNKEKEQLEKTTNRFRWPVPFLSGAAVATAILIIAGILFFKQLVYKYKVQVTTLPGQVLNINQDSMLVFNVKTRQEVKIVKIEIVLPYSIKFVRNGRLVTDSDRTISWKEKLIEGENIFSVCVRAVKQGDWHVKLKIKNPNLAQNIIMPVKVARTDIKI